MDTDTILVIIGALCSIVAGIISRKTPSKPANTPLGMIQKLCEEIPTFIANNDPNRVRQPDKEE